MAEPRKVTISFDCTACGSADVVVVAEFPDGIEHSADATVARDVEIECPRCGTRAPARVTVRRIPAVATGRGERIMASPDGGDVHVTVQVAG